MKRLLILLTGFLYFFLASCAQEEVTEFEVGYGPKATNNPFLAAERLVKQMGCEARSIGYLPDLEGNAVQNSSVLVLSAQVIELEQQRRQLQAWVAQGGHLILIIEGAEPYGWYSKPEPLTEEEESSVRLLLKDYDMNLEPLNTDSQNAVTVVEGHDASQTKYRLSLDARYQITREVKSNQIVTYNHSGFQQCAYGNGYLSVIASARPWRNRHLAEEDHAEFLWTLIEQNPLKHVYFIYGGTPPSWLAFMWKRAWPMLVIGMILLSLWLWRKGRRFGSILERQDKEHQSAKYQLRGIGHFFWRSKRGDILIEAARQRVRRHVYQQHAHLGLTEIDKLSLWIVEKTQLSEAQVRLAMQAPVGRDPLQFTEMMRILQKIQQSL